jgi:sec-independent protein translocase protein TatB
MFGVDSTELFIVAVLALIFIGPKELPGTLRILGQWVGRAKAHARHFTAGIENIMREAELEEMEKRWREENERIMREHPVALPYVGAAEEHGAVMTPLGADDRPSTSLGTNGDEGLDVPLVPSEVEASAVDEPTLPLPDPEHHRRELP